MDTFFTPAWAVQDGPFSHRSCSLMDQQWDLRVLSNPKNFAHYPANQFARSPEIKQNSNKDPDNRLPDKCAHAGIDIRQNVHELFFGLGIQ
jgi:hypothetical protein